MAIIIQGPGSSAGYALSAASQIMGGYASGKKRIAEEALMKARQKAYEEQAIKTAHENRISQERADFDAGTYGRTGTAVGAPGTDTGPLGGAPWAPGQEPDQTTAQPGPWAPGMQPGLSVGTSRSQAFLRKENAAFRKKLNEDPNAFIPGTESHPLVQRALAGSEELARALEKARRWRNPQDVAVAEGLSAAYAAQLEDAYAQVQSQMYQESLGSLKGLMLQVSNDGGIEEANMVEAFQNKLQREVENKKGSSHQELWASIQEIQSDFFEVHAMRQVEQSYRAQVKSWKQQPDEWQKVLDDMRMRPSYVDGDAEKATNLFAIGSSPEEAEITNSAGYATMLRDLSVAYDQISIARHGKSREWIPEALARTHKEYAGNLLEAQHGSWANLRDSLAAGDADSRQFILDSRSLYENAPVDAGLTGQALHAAKWQYMIDQQDKKMFAEGKAGLPESGYAWVLKQLEGEEPSVSTDIPAPAHAGPEAYKTAEPGAIAQTIEDLSPEGAASAETDKKVTESIVANKAATKEFASDLSAREHGYWSTSYAVEQKLMVSAFDALKSTSQLVPGEYPSRRYTEGNIEAARRVFAEAGYDPDKAMAHAAWKDLRQWKSTTAPESEAVEYDRTGFNVVKVAKELEEEVIDALDISTRKKGLWGTQIARLGGEQKYKDWIYESFGAYSSIEPGGSGLKGAVGRVSNDQAELFKIVVEAGMEPPVFGMDQRTKLSQMDTKSGALSPEGWAKVREINSSRPTGFTEGKLDAQQLYVPGRGSLYPTAEQLGIGTGTTPMNAFKWIMKGSGDAGKLERYKLVAEKFGTAGAYAKEEERKQHAEAFMDAGGPTFIEPGASGTPTPEEYGPGDRKGWDDFAPAGAPTMGPPEETEVDRFRREHDASMAKRDIDAKTSVRRREFGADLRDKMTTRMEDLNRLRSEMPEETWARLKGIDDFLVESVADNEAVSGARSPKRLAGDGLLVLNTLEKKFKKTSRSDPSGLNKSQALERISFLRKELKMLSAAKTWSDYPEGRTQEIRRLRGVLDELLSIAGMEPEGSVEAQLRAN